MRTIKLEIVRRQNWNKPPKFKAHAVGVGGTTWFYSKCEAIEEWMSTYASEHEAYRYHLPADAEMVTIELTS